MFAIPAIVLISALGETRVDPAELAKAQSALESYFGRIEALQITYTKTFTQSRAAKAGPQDPMMESNSGPRPVNDPTLHDDYDLLYAYPSVRLSVVERRRYTDGSIKETPRTTVLHRGALSQITPTQKHFVKKTSAHPNSFPLLPINPLGLRVRDTLNTPLSDFLKFPDITSFEGEEEIDGERAIVLKIGPHIPLPTRLAHWGEGAFLRVALAPEHNYLPMRMEIFPASEGTPGRDVKMTAGSFQPVQDMVRRNSVPFPHRLEIEYSNGNKTFWTVQSAVINPSVSEGDFALSPPPGYFVEIDGMPQTLSGGAEQQALRYKETVEEAKRLLSLSDPPRSSPRILTRFAWPLGLAAAAITVLALLAFFRWRQSYR